MFSVEDLNAVPISHSRGKSITNAMLTSSTYIQIFFQSCVCVTFAQPDPELRLIENPGRNPVLLRRLYMIELDEFLTHLNANNIC
jgi:hypothetical protein